MFDVFIIDLIREEEERLRRESRQPFLEVPLPEREPPEAGDEREERPEGERGVLIIECDEDYI